jgi:hypothetical protein
LLRRLGNHSYIDVQMDSRIVTSLFGSKNIKSYFFNCNNSPFNEQEENTFEHPSGLNYSEFKTSSDSNLGADHQLPFFDSISGLKGSLSKSIKLENLRMLPNSLLHSSGPQDADELRLPDIINLISDIQNAGHEICDNYDMLKSKTMEMEIKFKKARENLKVTKTNNEKILHQ